MLKCCVCVWVICHLSCLDAFSGRCLRQAHPGGDPGAEVPLEEQAGERTAPQTLQEPVLKLTDAHQSSHGCSKKTSKYGPDTRRSLNTKTIFDHLLNWSSELHLPSVQWTPVACLLCWLTVWMCTRCPLPAPNERFPTPDIWIPGRSSEWSNALDPVSGERTWQVLTQ